MSWFPGSARRKARRELRGMARVDVLVPGDIVLIMGIARTVHRRAPFGANQTRLTLAGDLVTIIPSATVVATYRETFK